MTKVLHIFNATGQEVANIDFGWRSAGEHHYDWQTVSLSGESLASGNYYYRVVLRAD